jgi:DNA-directed RNA polymerase subunit RPC12/RpoP
VVKKIYPIPYSVITVVKSFRFQIEHQCPQCGAPILLEETDRLIQCEYCRVRSFILSRVFQYILPSRIDPSKEIIYFPYWRIKGILFQCTASGINHRIIDLSYQGLPSRIFPISLGLRAQTLKLQFVSPEKRGYFIRPLIPLNTIKGIIEKRFQNGLSSKVYHQSLIGESFSFIYSPFYIDGKFFDAILNKPISSALDEGFSIKSFDGGPPEWEVKFISAQCPHCGWDLEAEKEALVLECKNCNTLWRSHGGKLKPLVCSHLPHHYDASYYLPFWKIRADVSGIELGSYADLVRLSNLPKVIRDSWESRTLYFWVPGFMARPLDILRFSRNLTIHQPFQGEVVGYPEGEKYPVTLPVEEATETLKTTIASLMRPARIMMPKLTEIHIKPTSFLLVYVPFERRGDELSNQEFRLRLDRKILGYF